MGAVGAGYKKRRPDKFGALSDDEIERSVAYHMRADPAKFVDNYRKVFGSQASDDEIIGWHQRSLSQQPEPDKAAAAQYGVEMRKAQAQKKAGAAIGSTEAAIGKSAPPDASGYDADLAARTKAQQARQSIITPEDIEQPRVKAYKDFDELAAAWRPGMKVQQVGTTAVLVDQSGNTVATLMPEAELPAFGKRTAGAMRATLDAFGVPKTEKSALDEHAATLERIGFTESNVNKPTTTNVLERGIGEFGGTQSSVLEPVARAIGEATGVKKKPALAYGLRSLGRDVMESVSPEVGESLAVPITSVARAGALANEGIDRAQGAWDEAQQAAWQALANRTEPGGWVNTKAQEYVQDNIREFAKEQRDVAADLARQQQLKERPLTPGDAGRYVGEWANVLSPNAGTAAVKLAGKGLQAGGRGLLAKAYPAGLPEDSVVGKLFRQPSMVGASKPEQAVVDAAQRSAQNDAMMVARRLEQEFMDDVAKAGIPAESLDAMLKAPTFEAGAYDLVARGQLDDDAAKRLMDAYQVLHQKGANILGITPEQYNPLHLMRGQDPTKASGKIASLAAQQGELPAPTMARDLPNPKQVRQLPGLRMLPEVDPRVAAQKALSDAQEAALQQEMAASGADRQLLEAMAERGLRAESGKLTDAELAELLAEQSRRAVGAAERAAPALGKKAGAVQDVVHGVMGKYSDKELQQQAAERLAAAEAAGTDTAMNRFISDADAALKRGKQADAGAFAAKVEGVDRVQGEAARRLQPLLTDRQNAILKQLGVTDPARAARIRSLAMQRTVDPNARFARAAGERIAKSTAGARKALADAEQAFAGGLPPGLQDKQLTPRQFAEGWVAQAAKDGDPINARRALDAMESVDPARGVLRSVKAGLDNTDEKMRVFIQEISTPEAKQVFKDRYPLAWENIEQVVDKFDPKFNVRLKQVGDNVLPLKVQDELASRNYVVAGGAYDTGKRVGMPAVDGIPPGTILPRRLYDAISNTRDNFNAVAPGYARLLNDWLAAPQMNQVVTRGQMGFQARNLFNMLHRAIVDQGYWTGLGNPEFKREVGRVSRAMYGSGGDNMYGYSASQLREMGEKYLSLGRGFTGEMREEVAEKVYAPGWLEKVSPRAAALQEKAVGLRMAPGRIVNEKADDAFKAALFGGTLNPKYSADDGIRLMHWLAQVKQGVDPKVAAKETMDLMIDYGAQTPALRAVLPFAPFARYHLGAMGSTFKLAMEHPERYRHVYKVMEAIEGYDTRAHGDQRINPKFKSGAMLAAGMPLTGAGRDALGNEVFTAWRPETVASEVVANAATAGSLYDMLTGQQTEEGERTFGALAGPRITSTLNFLGYEPGGFPLIPAPKDVRDAVRANAKERFGAPIAYAQLAEAYQHPEAKKMLGDNPLLAAILMGAEATPGMDAVIPLEYLRLLNSMGGAANRGDEAAEQYRNRFLVKSATGFRQTPVTPYGEGLNRALQSGKRPKTLLEMRQRGYSTGGMTP